MGRWDNGGGGPKKRNRNMPKFYKKIIYLGFVIVAIVVLTVFISTAGLNIEIIQRGTEVQTISVKVSNNNFFSITGVTVQFDNGKVQSIGNMGPFSSVFVSPDGGNPDFQRVIVKANDGQIQSIKDR